MTQANPSISDVVRDPLWLADRYDPLHDAVHFRYVDREQHRTATFLTDEYLGKSETPVIIRREDAIAAGAARAPVCFVFHSAFCCSTLLARALDVSNVAMSLKEPVILNDIAGWQMRGADSRKVGSALHSAISLLARPFETGEKIVIKPSNLCNYLAESMMRQCNNARAVLLYAPLPIFLGSIARKGLWGRLWVRELMLKQLKQGFVDFGLSDEDYVGLTDLQAAAIGWLAQQSFFMKMCDRFDATHIGTLNSEILLARPVEAIAKLSTHFGLDLNMQMISEIVAGPAFTRHSKFDVVFDMKARVTEQENAAKLHGDEIEKICEWAKVVARNNNITMNLPRSLIEHPKQ